MRQACEMSPDEQSKRMVVMRETIKTNDVHRWAQNFLTPAR